MVTAVLVVTGVHPASVQVSEATQIVEPTRQGWVRSSIEHFVEGGARREFVLGPNGRIEVHDLPESAAGLEDASERIRISSDQTRFDFGLTVARSIAPVLDLANINTAKDAD